MHNGQLQEKKSDWPELSSGAFWRWHGARKAWLDWFEARGESNGKSDFASLTVLMLPDSCGQCALPLLFVIKNTCSSSWVWAEVTLSHSLQSPLLRWKYTFPFFWGGGFYIFILFSVLFCFQHIPISDSPTLSLLPVAVSSPRSTPQFPFKKRFPRDFSWMQHNKIQ